MSSSAEEPSPTWLALPRDITVAILQRLGAIDILNNAQRVCKQWRSICKEPSMWKTIDMRNGGDRMKKQEDLEAMCRNAVDRSCGGLVDISIEHFATNELLNYITDRCTQIKCLRLVSCDYAWDQGLWEVAARLPLLEDLELSYCSFTSAALEVVGHLCPRLKSLKLNRRGTRYPVIIPSDEEEEIIATTMPEAEVIARTMPELRRLQLFGNQLTNEGLQAILDGCPYLEFLDLRQCFNVDLNGKLGKRCAEQVKDLRRPFDPTDDYEYSTLLQEVLDDAFFQEHHPPFVWDIDIVMDGDDQYGSEYEYDCGCDCGLSDSD